MNEKLDLEPRPQSVTTLWDAEWLPLIQEVGNKMGVNVVVKAREGDLYSTQSGFKVPVREGGVQIEIQNTLNYSKQHGPGLSSFWRKVDDTLQIAKTELKKSSPKMISSRT